MGSSGKGGSTTIGHKYFMGQHVVVCQTPIDALTDIQFGERNAWKGYANDKRISVYKPNLFGGKSGEGGVSGSIDVLGGGPDQTVNDYLDENLEGLVPSFRGVFSLVFRQFYFTNNPYLKALWLKVQNVFSTYGNWLPDLAPVNSALTLEDTAIYICLDRSQSMAINSRLETLQTGIKNFLAQIPFGNNTPIKIVTFSNTINSRGEWMEWNEQALAEANVLIDGMSGFSSTQTRMNAAVSEAADFFDDADTNASPLSVDVIDGASAITDAILSIGSIDAPLPLDRFLIMVTDGGGIEINSADEARTTLDGIARLETLAIQVGEFETDAADLISDLPTAVIDDFDSKGVTEAAASRINGHRDINPAHILRHILIAPNANGSGDDSLIGPSFAAAARTFFDEGMGLSLFWQNTQDLESFKTKVEKHANCAVYQDRQTGLWEIKTIRPDYTFGDLFVVDETMIDDWEIPPERTDQAELPNQITLIYTRRDNGQEASVQLENNAAIQVRGSIKSETVKLRGITSDVLANQVCQRELVARTQPISKGTVRLTYFPPSLNIGFPFIINDPRVNLENVVCRVLEIEETDGLDNSIVVTFAEDVFGLDMSAAPAADIEVVVFPDETPLASEVRFVEELPYYEMVQVFGELDAQDRLAADPDAGIWGATAIAPNKQHLELYLTREDAGNFVSAGTTEFAASWLLISALSRDPTETTFTTTRNNRETEILVNELIQINDEIMRVDAIADDGTTVTFTVGRGVLDTPPQDHSVGDRAIAWQSAYTSDLIEYTSGETVTLKLLPATRSGILPLAKADADSVVFKSRAVRPFPVGNFQIDSQYLVAVPIIGTVSGSWAHRDRLFQTTAVPDAYTAGNIGPETGVTYQPFMKIYNQWTDVFAFADIFDVFDIFTDSNSFDQVFFDDIGAPQATAYDFDVADLDIFSLSDVFAASDIFENAFTDNTIQIGLGVRVSRDGYDNFRDAEITAKPLLPPINFTGV